MSLDSCVKMLEIVEGLEAEYLDADMVPVAAVSGILSIMRDYVGVVATLSGCLDDVQERLEKMTGV